MKLKDSLPLKIALMGVLALLMLIPLAMVMGQIEDRQDAADSSRDEVSASWGRAQTLTGPVLKLSYETELLDKDQKKTVKLATGTVYPRTLDYDIDAQTQTLHRSIYDIMVYGADVVVTGDFVIPAYFAGENLKEQLVVTGMTDLRGIDGSVDITLGTSPWVIRPTPSIPVPASWTSICPTTAREPFPRPSSWTWPSWTERRSSRSGLPIA